MIVPDPSAWPPWSECVILTTPGPTCCTARMLCSSALVSPLWDGLTLAGAADAAALLGAGLAAAELGAVDGAADVAACPAEDGAAAGIPAHALSSRHKQIGKRDRVVIASR